MTASIENPDMEQGKSQAPHFSQPEQEDQIKDMELLSEFRNSASFNKYVSEFISDLETKYIRKKKKEEKRKAAASKIDPNTAVTTCCYAQIMDPYGDEPYLPSEYDCLGMVYFAREPNGEVWVEFNDLPGEVAKALKERIFSHNDAEENDFAPDAIPGGDDEFPF